LAFLAAGLAVLGLAPGARAGLERFEGPPPWRVGGRVGFTLDAAALPDSAGYSFEVYLRVPPATIEQLSRDATGQGRLQAAVRVRGRFGSRVSQVSREFVIPAADASLGQGKVIVMRFPAAPGPCQLEARMADLESERPGLRKGHEDSGIAGELEIPRPTAGRDLSHLQFLWPVTDSTVDRSFERRGRLLVPNPDRLYGLFAEQLRASFVARARPNDARAWHWVARVFTAGGEGVAQRESTGAAAPLLDADVSFDLSGEPSGAYELEVKAWQDGDTDALLRRERFSVGWQRGTWLRNAADANDEVHFLLQAEDEEAFIRMQPGEQEAFLDAFWRRRDPTPTTAYNEALETFHARVRHANETFARAGVERGMFSDMGRVYIRYGEPAEVLHQVVPAGESTLEQQLQSILDSEDRQPLDVNQKGLGGDMRPFEVWVYEGDIPLPPDADPSAALHGRSHRRLLFLFVDDQGTGLFRLRYSTE
jgi:GWxTD domain-containing protein